MLNKCQICGKVANLEEHHIIPVAYGGDKNGRTVYICESCHFCVHKTAESLMSKNPAKKNWFEDEDTLKKASIYIKAVIDAKRNYKEGNVSQDLRKRRMIVIEMSDFEWKRLHKIKADKGFSNLEKFIEANLRNLTKSI